ncbi:MAG: single-stranded DNA-binding protein [Campylobacterota bacterium]|nr:single-stranded DNA-binding protein [Campylobacterota bacterium]
MYNKVILVGNLTRDVEIRYSQSGSAIGSSGLATNRKWKSQTGEQKEEVMFIDVTFFGRTAEIANQYLRKGRRVLIEGRLSFQQWVAQDGSKRSKHEIIVENLQMLGSRDDAMGGNSGSTGMNGGYDNNPMPQSNQGYQNNQMNQPPQQNTPPPSNSYNEPMHNAPTQQTKQEIPEIDISEDEIPF